MTNFINTDENINIPTINYGRFFWDLIYYFLVFMLIGNLLQGIAVDAFGNIR